MVKKNDKCAFSVKVGERGQIVIPKTVRDMLSIEAGDILLLLCDIERGIAIPTKEKTDEILNLNYIHVSGGEE